MEMGNNYELLCMFDWLAWYSTRYILQSTALARVLPGTETCYYQTTPVVKVPNLLVVISLAAGKATKPAQIIPKPITAFGTLDPILQTVRRRRIVTTFYKVIMAY
jgi:hypothetical protein